MADGIYVYCLKFFIYRFVQIVDRILAQTADEPGKQNHFIIGGGF